MGFVKLEKQGHVGIMTIDRQEALNALNSAVLTDLDAAIDQAEQDSEIYVVILTGAGRSFVAGADIGEMKEFSSIDGKKVIGAAEAKAIGLVSEVYPPEELMGKAMEMAEAICANAQIAVCESKRCIRKGMQTDINTGSSFEAEAFGVTCGTRDKDEGMGAFLEKRAEKHFQNK